MAYMCDYIIEMNQKNIRNYGATGEIKMLLEDIFKTKKHAFNEEEIEEYREALQEIIDEWQAR